MVIGMVLVLYRQEFDELKQSFSFDDLLAPRTMTAQTCSIYAESRWEGLCCALDLATLSS